MLLIYTTFELNFTVTERVAFTCCCDVIALDFMAEEHRSRLLIVATAE
jgi:hypothetical protein